MAKELRTPWTIRPRTAGVICACFCGLGAVLFLSHTGRLGLPGTGSSDAVLGPPIKGVAREDRTVIARVKQTEDGGRIEGLVVSKQPEVGRLTVTRGDTLVYVPPPNFNGKVSAGYEACWSGDGCRAGVVTLAVRAVNDSPIARDDTAITGRGKAVAIDVLANDSDPDGDRLSIRSVADPRSGGRTRIAGHWILWTPRPRFRGVTRIPYAAVDKHGGTSRASVTIRVGAATVAPSTSPAAVEFSRDTPTSAEHPRDPFLQPSPPLVENGPPQAARDRVSVPAGGTVIIDVLANDRDPDGNRLSIISVDVPGAGVAKQVGDRIQFSAPLTSEGDISFGYSVVDSAGATGWSLVSVSVLQVSQGPTDKAPRSP